MVQLWGGASGGAELSGPGCKDHSTAHSQGFTTSATALWGMLELPGE